MRILLDTNVLLRYANEEDPLHAEVYQGIRRLTADERELCVVPQGIFEFWVVATRPLEVNGLGLDPEQTRREVDALLSTFVLLPEPEDLVQRWLDICTTHAVCGRPAHDARLVAVMQAHEISRLLTLNPDDFKRYPEVSCLAPAEA